jgi:quinoprotein glucose dehydrogenase
MFRRSLLSSSARRGIGGWLVIALAVLIVILGLVILGGGVWLITLGGSWYYLFAGVGLIASGVLMLLGSAVGVWVYVLTCAFTWIWAVWEAGLDGWALVPRVVGPTVLAILALLSLPVLWRHGPRPEVAVEPDPGRRARQPRYDRATVPLIALVAVAAALTATVKLGTAQNAAPSAPAPEAPAPAVTPVTETAGDDWPAYGGTDHALRYSSLDQINRQNVRHLQRVWTYRTGDLPDEETKGKYSPETTPIKVGDRIYLCSAKNILISLDAATGREWWRYDPKVTDDNIPYGATCRGVAYYRNPAAAPDELCAERIIEGTLDARLIAIDARRGILCPSFGTSGNVDLLEGIGRTVPGWYGNVAAITIVRGIVVVGGQVRDGQAEDAPSGVIRGYDAVTGQLAWAWDMCRPDRTGAPPPGETYTRGTPNMWTSAAADEELGYVYVPLGNSSVDYYGGNRLDCENEFSSSLVAIDVTTGRDAWHFQTVHYDLWDYDLGSQPSLVDLPTDAGIVPAVILPSKQGEIYVLDRRTGTSLFPVQEREVPSGGVEPQNLSKTQPFSTYATLAEPPLTEKDMWGMSPLDQLWCRIQFRRVTYQGEFTPPQLDAYYLEYPGYNGGSDWGSVAVDPRRGVIIANYNDMPNFDRLVSREEADRLHVAPIDQPVGDEEPRTDIDPQAGAPYAVYVDAGWRLKWTGLMCKRPPYGHIRAIELGTGKTLWDRPFGEARENGPFHIPSKLPLTIGTPNNGGAVITAGGLVFIAATTDNLIRAIDIETGKVLWQDELPAGGQANPMAFAAGGREYIAIMAGGHHFMETPVGDYVVAYALPAETGAQ